MIKTLFTEFRTVTLIVIIILLTITIALAFNWFLNRFIKKSLLNHHKDLT